METRGTQKLGASQSNPGPQIVGKNFIGQKSQVSYDFTQWALSLKVESKGTFFPFVT